MIRISRWTAFAVSSATAATLATAMAVLAVPDAHTAQPQSNRAPSSQDDFQGMLDDLVKTKAATAVLLRVRTAGGGEWSGAAGLSDVRTGRPADPAGYFRIGSVTKTFAATVLLQLVDERRLRLDDPVAEHLPGVVPDGERITVRQILQHTSLLRDYMSDPGWSTNRWRGAQRFRAYKPDRLLAQAFRTPAQNPPDVTWKYSNTNYVVVGKLIERLTGRPYGDEVERRVLRPLRLTQTIVPGDRPGLPRPHAHGYALLPDGRTVDATRMNPSLDWAAGEMISTTRDLGRFLDGLLGGRLLSPATLAAMRAVHPTGAGFAYGLGLQEYALPCGKRMIGHSGQLIGYTTYALRSDDGRQMNLSVNLGSSPPSADKLYAFAGKVFC
ncbi:D-alanyl-D-alanine carboxypeptidase [Actinomadura glauciflava]|uniref:serine hydrolase domain-containing protein n=1 Tax=Actinomadura luteofluorescens TaxID=46163 RepID=UPI002164926D|nr:serine hydrolase domain-containing protein [Actinomadura glauciflava]MCR3745825.1 D-alanyl-D-alanine carboxypeptidase [Actinomadura glauciflava]